MSEFDHYTGEMCSCPEEGELFHHNLGYTESETVVMIYALVCDTCDYTYHFAFDCEDCLDLLRVH